MRHLLSLSLSLPLMLLGLSGCATISQYMPWYSPNDVEQISVYVKPDPQINHAIEIDVVFVYSDTLETMLNGFSSQQWFEQKSGIISGYSHEMETLSWQLVSGYSDNSKSLPEKHKDALTVIAFANYPSNPNTKAVITNLETPWLIFDAAKMTVQNKAPIPSGKSVAITKSDNDDESSGESK